MVVAADPARLAVLEQRLDLRTVVGKAIQPSVLRVAGIADTDMLIARGPQDETKLFARKVAHDLFGCRRRSRACAATSSRTAARCSTGSALRSTRLQGWQHDVQ
jgi:Trk K+ transport system NAD-binding subunit